MSTRANWFVDVELTGDEDDFAPHLTCEGIQVDLRDPGALTAAVKLLKLRECELYTAKITCPIREHHDVVCTACPVRHRDPEDPMTELCRICVERESLTTTLRVLAVEQSCSSGRSQQDG